MRKPIDKNSYNRFINSSRFFIQGNKSIREVQPFHEGFIKVFSMRGLLTKEQIDIIKRLAKRSEADAREYIELELIEGMGV